MIQIQTEGRRTYIVGDTYPVRDRIRALGAHWDAERKAWWTAKRDEAEQLVAQLTQTQTNSQTNSQTNKTPRDGLNSIVAGRATYKGKTYYLAGRVERGDTRWDDEVRAIETRDGTKVLLYFRDGSSQFWAARELVEIVKHYDRPQTIQGLRDFASRNKREAQETGIDCWACRQAAERGNLWLHLHDGCEVCGAEG